MALILLQVLVLAVTAGAVDDVGVRWQDGGCTLADWKPVLRRQPPPPLQGESLATSLWKRDLTRRSSPSGTLEVMKADDELRCEVHHQADVVLGYPLSLYWSYTDRKLEVHQGEKARTSPISIAPCYLDGGNPATDGNTWPRTDRYFTAQSDRLTLDLNKDSHLQYRCKASQPDDDDDDTVALTCPLHRWPNVKLKWDVRRGAGTDAVLPPIFAPREEGVYSCTAEGNKDAIEPPRMLYPPQSKQAPPAGTVRFNCTAAGNPKPTVTWYKNGEPLVTSSGAINIRNSTNFERLELVVSSLTVGDAGVYQCIAHNAGGFVSGWAQLNVTVSPVLAPVDVTCAPLSASAVQVRWRPAVVSNSSGDLAYTVSIKLKDKPGANDGVTPPTNLVYKEIRLAKPLTPYQFQVRAYRTAGASNLSHPVVCQGQGVPINMSVAGEGSVLVSWRTFAEQNPGVVEWRLEYKPQDNDDVQNVTLPAGVHNYTLRVSASEPLLVRVLGSRTAEWLPQNLTLVPWLSTTRAGEDYGELDAYVDDVVVTLVRDRSVSLRWRCVRCPQLHKVHVCAQTQQRTEVCRNTSKTNVTLEGLYPETDYELRIQVTAGRAAGKVGTVYNIVTLPDGPAPIKDLAHKFVNDSALLLSWSGAGAYTVHYSAHLLLPIESWAAIDVVGNSVLITGIKPSNTTFVMVTGHDPPARSSVITVPPFALTPVESKEKTFVSAAKDEIQYEFVDNDVVIRWAGGGSRLVRYSQNITRPIEDWAKADSSDGFFQFHLDGFNPNLPLYVQVISRTEQLDGAYGPVLTIPPRPATTNNFYLNLILGCAVGALCVLVILSAYIWRRRRRLSKSARSRRSHVATSSPEEDGSEMKTVGARLCNGAGEPLLNGHVHITENPASKTPNGRMKRGRRLDSQFEAFDVSRHDADTTQETTLGDSALDLTRSGPKMPDDNMNVEGGFRDNSQQPTLQPNG